MKVFLVADQDGHDLKNILKTHLIEQSHDVEDLTKTPADDFVDSTSLLVEQLDEDEKSLGIAIDAYGAGSFIAANKHKNAIVAEISDERTAYMTREHNNARIITMGSEIVGTELAKNIATEFLAADYDGGRHQIRVDMLDAMC